MQTSYEQRNYDNTTKGGEIVSLKRMRAISTLFSPIPRLAFRPLHAHVGKLNESCLMDGEKESEGLGRVPAWGILKGRRRPGLRLIRRMLLVAGLSVPLAACAPAPIPAWVVQSEYGGSPVLLWTNTRVAGAIDGLVWRGMQFIDSYDHGRQLQSALHMNGNGECYNPTQAGSMRDGSGPSSSSRLLEVKAEGKVLHAKTQMAFWLAPGERSAHCGGRPGEAKNNATLSDVVLESTATIAGNVIRHDVTYVLPREYESVIFEALTAYMPIRFSTIYGLDLRTESLESIGPGPGGQPLPVILATADGNYALGVYSPPAPGLLGFGRWLFPDVWGPTAKWNCAFRFWNVAAGRHAFTCYSVFGTLDEVRTTIQRLHRS